MPKGLNFKGFVRRKSSGNLLDHSNGDEESSGGAPNETSTFRVLERPEKKGVTYGAVPDRNSVTRPFDSSIHALRGKSENDVSRGTARQLPAGWPLTGATRGSGGTTNSGSSGFYDSSSASAKHSSTSTLPSSIDPDRQPEEEELFPPRAATSSGMSQTVSAGAEDHAPLPPPPSWSSRAVRSWSFGKKSGKGEPPDIQPAPPAHQSQTNGSSTHSSNAQRDRAMTTSSYASTAVPTKPELNFGNDFGGDDFSSSMFDGLQKKEAPPPLPIAGSFHRTDSEPLFPPRTLSRDTISKSPSPDPLQLNRNQSSSPYSYDEPNSARWSESSALSSDDQGNTNNGSAINGFAQAFLGNSKPGYAPVPERYTSPGLERSRTTESFSEAGFTVENGSGKEQEYPTRQIQVDEDDRWVKKVELRDPQASTSAGLTPETSRGKAPYGISSTRAGAASPGSSAGNSWVGSESITTTPRAAGRNGVTQDEDSMFDTSPAGPASRAVRPAMAPKRMTNAQFQALQNEKSTSDEEEEQNDSGEEYEDVDDVERAKRLAAQRRQQEATMSVYRQQMKKVTGGGPADLSSSGASIRPPNDRSSSSPSGFYFGGISGTPPADTVRGKDLGDDDEDVPLGILQAHGFPSANRPPTVGENDMQQRRASMAGSMMGGGSGNLPAFARNLPADPYFGAGLVRQSNRESLAMNGAGSVYGMPAGPQASMHMGQQPVGHPGGLVGVIAGEEKARAARRGSHMPTNAPAPHMGRAMSMGNIPPPSVYTPSGVPMPMMPHMGMPQMGRMPTTPGTEPHMQQILQIQLQMMQNMLDMQQMQLGQPGQPMLQPSPHQGNGYLGGNRPMSIASHNSFQGAPQNQGRSMTMMNLPPGWNTSSSPGQSRPISVMPGMGGSYAPSTNGLQVNGNGLGAGYTPSIAPSERSNVGMPNRYRPVSQYGEPAGRSQSMTSSPTLQALNNQQSITGSGTPYNASQAQTPNSTIRVVEKAKGGPRMNNSRPAVADDEEDEAWADAKRKREEKKKSRFNFSRNKKEAPLQDEALNDLYRDME